MTSTIHQKEHNRGLIVGLLGILTAFGPLSIDMYLPSLPHIAEDLNTSLGSVQFSLSAFFIGLASAQLLYGYPDSVVFRLYVNPAAIASDEGCRWPAAGLKNTITLSLPV